MITPIDDAMAYIETHPDMFLRAQGIQGAELASNMVYDALLLTQGSVTVSYDNGWWIVSGTIDWVASATGDGIRAAFTRIIPLPEAGPNSMRGEILVTTFAQDVVTVSMDDQLVIKGEVSSDDDIWAVVAANPEMRRIIAFRLPKSG